MVTPWDPAIDRLRVNLNGVATGLRQFARAGIAARFAGRRVGPRLKGTVA